MSLFISHPWWYLLACPLVGLLYAWLLYGRTADFSRSWKRGLFLLRFLLVSLALLLLFDPLIHHIKTSYTRPALVVLADNSSSMTLAADSVQVRKDVPGIHTQLSQKLSGEYEVLSWQFDADTYLHNENTSLYFNGNQTAIGDALAKISQRFLPGELAGVVLISDGINNSGKEPLSVAQTLQVPVFTVATGDTSLRLDLALRQIYYNRETFAGNNFPIEINFKASGAGGKKSRLEILFDERIVWSQDFSILNNNQSFTFTPLLNAPREGLLKFIVRVAGIQGENNLKNNTATVWVDARKKPTRILMLSEGPHPDVGALRDIFTESKMFEARWLTVDELNITDNNYDLVIFIGLPTSRHDIAPMVEALQKQQKPVLFILGSNTDANRFNRLNTGIFISSATGKPTGFYPVYNSGFGLFKVSSRLLDRVNFLPPLIGPEGVYDARPGIEVLMYQKISGVETSYPMMAFSRSAGQSMGVICGEGIWWWRNILFKELGTHQDFRELMTSVILYLAGGAEKGNFRVRAPQRLRQGEHAYFTAELFNPSFESINDPDVNLKLTDSRGNVFPFQFSRRETGYSLDAGILEPGIWKWEASTVFAGKSYVEGGMFVVEENLAEALNLQADHMLLNSLATATGGKMVYLNQINRLPDLIRQIAPPTIHVSEEESFSSIFDLWPLMLVLFVLIATEWGIRKYNGIL